MRIIDKLINTLSPSMRKMIKEINSKVDLDLTKYGFLTVERWNKIKNYINPNVKSIRMDISVGVKEDLEFLKRFSMLEKIEFGEFDIISNRELDILASLGIKEVSIGIVNLDYEKRNINYSSVSYGEKSKLIYNGVLVNVLLPNRINSDKVVIEVQELDKNLIESLLSGFEIDNFGEVVVNNIYDNSSYGIKRENGMNVITISSKNVDDAQKFYSYFKNSGINIRKISFSIFLSDVSSLTLLNRLVTYFNDENINEIELECVGFFDCLIKGRVVEKVEWGSSTLEDIEKSFQIFEKNDYKVSNFKVSLINVNKYRTDYEILRKISKKTNLIIGYSDLFECNYEEFESLVESVKWYRELIDSNDLSPVEKLLYGYDIVKSFTYNDENVEEGKLGRAPHMILTDPRIVCTGYSLLMEEVFSYYDSNVGVCRLSVKDINHSRIIARVDDDKYNIHGVFAMDPTWDSNLKEEAKKDKKFLDNYNGLDYYKFFLVPMCDYFRLFNTEEKPSIYNEPDNLYESIKVNFQLKKLFGKDRSKEKLREYSKEKRPSLEQFISMLINVRVSEGYNLEDAKEEALRIVEINKESIKYNNENFQKNLSFFESEVKSRL